MLQCYMTSFRVVQYKTFFSLSLSLHSALTAAFCLFTFFSLYFCHSVWVGCRTCTHVSTLNSIRTIMYADASSVVSCLFPRFNDATFFLVYTTFCQLKTEILHNTAKNAFISARNN